MNVTLANITAGRADVAVDGKIVGRVVRTTEDYYTETWGNEVQREAAHNRRHGGIGRTRCGTLLHFRGCLRVGEPRSNLPSGN